MHYCDRYDDFYRSVYEQGIPYWQAGPDGCRDIIQHTIAHILEAFPNPAGRALIDVGCGEGLCAAAIAGLDIAYTGVDRSPHVIDKARERARGHPGKIRFGVADLICAESELLHERYDLVLDEACFHMFLLDADRRQYLANLAALMKHNATLLMLAALCEEDAYPGEIRTLEQYQQHFQRDLNQPTPWDAWDGEKYVQLKLPTFATRPKSKASYIRELEEAGCTIVEAHQHPRGHKFDFVLKLRQACANQ